MNTKCMPIIPLIILVNLNLNLRSEMSLTNTASQQSQQAYQLIVRKQSAWSLPKTRRLYGIRMSRTPGCARRAPGVWDRFIPAQAWNSFFGDVTMGQWCHNQQTSIKWPCYPLKLIGIYVHVNTHNKESLTQRRRRLTSVQLCLIFLYISI